MEASVKRFAMVGAMSLVLAFVISGCGDNAPSEHVGSYDYHVDPSGREIDLVKAELTKNNIKYSYGGTARYFISVTNPERAREIIKEVVSKNNLKSISLYPEKDSVTKKKE